MASSTPRIRSSPVSVEVIGLWRCGTCVGPSALAKLYEFADLGFPERRQRLVVGKGNTADIRLEGDVLISRRHFSIWAEGGAIYVQDEGSQNGTRLNGIPLRQRERLEVGMRIACGVTELEAVDATGNLSISGRSYESFLTAAWQRYGSDREAARRVGRSYMTIRRADERKKERTK